MEELIAGPLMVEVRDSTALYDAIGDAAAYRLVRDHEGTVVKTIRDAV